MKHGLAPCRLVVACSGGIDSTALLVALTELPDYQVHCAHVNHHLRGHESDADEAFVRELCARLGVELHVADGTLDADAVRTSGVEAAARAVRYERLTAVREQTGARFVATAHQKNDQAETIAMRLITGSGLAGLRGIHPIRDDGFIRPLLDVTRDELASFLAARGITSRHDRSNDDPRFLRNRVRAALREAGGIDDLAAIAEQARTRWPHVERAIDEAEREGVRVAPGETRFLRWPDDAWMRQALLHRHIHRLDSQARDVSSAGLQRLASSVASLKRVTVTKRLELVREGDALVLRAPRRATPAFEVELTPESPAAIAEISSTIFCRGGLRPPEPPSSNRAMIKLPPHAHPHFTVRNRRPGDRFHPLGFHSAKKLKDFFIDRKIPAGIRDRLPLVLWNGEIVWIAGVEVSERFKVADGAGTIYEMWLEESGAASDHRQTDLQRG